MMWSETVTFGGSALDRAAELRSQAHQHLRSPSARAIVLWRGKVLIEGSALVRLATDHPALAGAETTILLGRDGDLLLFAFDISAWEPVDQDTASLGAFFDPSQQQHPELPDTQVFSELRAVMSQLSARDAELAATARAVLEWHRIHRFCARCGAESVPTQGGWQRDCPACGGHHFPRTDPVVIMLVTHGNSVLVGRSPGWPEGMYSLLAGFVEPGETIEAAVRREVLEESGVKVGDVRYLASQPWPFPASLMFGCHGEALSTKITLDPAELEDARWMSREEVALAFDGRHSEVKPARKGAIAHFLLQNWLADNLSG